MAEIYKARLEGIGGFQRTFAIKRILPNLSQNADYITMLVDEAKVAGLLSHANIVQILDLGQVEGVWFIAMEYVHGPDLGHVLARVREKGLRLPVPHAVFIAVELLKALEYAHQKTVMRNGRPIALNIIHRDVSPPNILLSYQGEVKLTDFGIARASLKILETVSHLAAGRFDYMSPEQADAVKDLDQRSDLFTVGVVLYEMLTGEHPFRGESELATVERVRVGRYRPLSAHNPDVPFTLETIVDRALCVDRSERFPDATAFKEALDRFFHDSGFLFTHANLSSYIRGLFPGESGARDPVGGSAVQFSNMDPDPTTDIDESYVDADSPTGRVRGLADVPTEGVATSVSLDSQDFPDAWESDAEQETVVRRVPGFGADDPTKLRNEIPDDFLSDGEQETVVRRIPREDPPTLPSSSPDDVLELDEDMRVDAVSSTGRSRSRTTTGHGPRSRGLGSFGWMVAVTMLLGGLLLGGAIGAVGAMVVDDFIRADSPAIVLVDAPVGTAILLDGDAVMGEVVVTPGPHRLEIQVRGRAPIVREFVAEPGEQRVFFIERNPDESGGSR